MGVEELDNEIAAVEDDINALFKEVESLEAEKIDLENKLEELRKGNKETEDERHENKVNGIDRPSMMACRYFDESLKQYFEKEIDLRTANTPDDAAIKKRKLEHATKEVGQKTKEMVFLEDKILNENIHRLGGITAFPVNQFLFTPDDEILGIRFDVYSYFKKSFVTPYYAILTKMSQVTKGSSTSRRWVVKSHTLPLYVPVEDYCEEIVHSQDDFLTFAQRVRRDLLRIQHRHDKIDSLLKLKYKHFGNEASKRKDRSIISRIEKDIQCRRVSILFPFRGEKKGNRITLNITCGDETINEATCVYHQPEVEEAITNICQKNLRNLNFSKDLIKAFKEIAKELIEAGYI